MYIIYIKEKMRRKIVPHGPSSLTISLPSQWVKQHNLKKGQELDVSDEDSYLKIKPVSLSNAPKKIEVSFIGLDADTWKDILLTLHKKGYDDVKINYSRKDTIKEVHAYLNSMQLGFEIIKQEANSLFIKNITNPEAEEFDTLFRRLYWIAIEYTHRIEAIMKNQEDITHSLLLHENSIIRISNYCKRIIVKEKRKDAVFLYSILENITSIAGNLTSLLKDIKEKEVLLSKEYIARYSVSCGLLSKTSDLYYKFSLSDYSSIKKSLDTQKKDMQNTKTEKSCYKEYLDSINDCIRSILESTLILHY
jgi:phosphate uptake regulator